jgi:hypothetical protein
MITVLFSPFSNNFTFNVGITFSTSPFSLVFYGVVSIFFDTLLLISTLSKFSFAGTMPKT